MTQQKLYRSILILGASAVLFLIAFNLPMLWFVAFLIPLAYLAAGLSEPPQKAQWLAVCFAILVLAIRPKLGTLIFSLTFVITPAFCGYWIQRGHRPETIVSRTIISSYLSLIITSMLWRQVYGIGAVETLRHSTFRLAEVAGDFLRMFFANFELDAMKLSILLGELFPTVLFLMAVIWSGVILASAMLLRRLRLVSFEPIRLDQFRFQGLNIGQLLGFLGFLYGAIFLTADEILLRNVTSIIYIIFSIQGVSLVWYVLKKQKVTKVKGFLFLAISLMIPLIQRIFGIIGLMDNAFDFRKMEQPK